MQRRWVAVGEQNATALSAVVFVARKGPLGSGYRSIQNYRRQAFGLEAVSFSDKFAPVPPPPKLY